MRLVWLWSVAAAAAVAAGGAVTDEDNAVQGGRVKGARVEAWPEAAVEGTRRRPASHHAHQAPAGCVSDGAVFGEGSAMVSPDECSYCFCIRGRRQCVAPKCLLPLDGCRPRYRASSCCPHHYECQNSTTTTTTTPRPPAECVVSGRRYVAGSRVDGHGGPCESCFCMGGQVRCVTKSCAPAIPGCTPVMKPGRCCPVKYQCDDGKNRDHLLQLLQGKVSRHRGKPGWRGGRTRRSPQDQVTGVGEVFWLMDRHDVVEPTTEPSVRAPVAVGTGMNVKGSLEDAVRFGPILILDNRVRTDRQRRVNDTEGAAEDVTEVPTEETTLQKESVASVSGTEEADLVSQPEETPAAEAVVEPEVDVIELTTLFSLSTPEITARSETEGASSSTGATPEAPLEEASPATEQVSPLATEIDDFSYDDIVYGDSENATGFASYDITVGTSVLASPPGSSGSSGSVGVGQVIPVDLEAERKTADTEGLEAEHKTGDVIDLEVEHKTADTADLEAEHETPELLDEELKMTNESSEPDTPRPSLLGQLLNIFTRPERPERPERPKPIRPPPPPPGLRPRPGLEGRPRPPFLGRPRPVLEGRPPRPDLEGRPPRPDLEGRPPRPAFIPPRFRFTPAPETDFEENESPATTTAPDPQPTTTPALPPFFTLPADLPEPIHSQNDPEDPEFDPDVLGVAPGLHSRDDLPFIHPDLPPPSRPVLPPSLRPDLPPPPPRPPTLALRPEVFPSRPEVGPFVPGPPSEPVMEGGFQAIREEGIVPHFDYEYETDGEPTLPPSLPNLKIIPFVAADALTNDELAGVSGEDLRPTPRPALPQDEDIGEQNDTTEPNAATTTRRPIIRLGDRRPPPPPRRPFSRPNNTTIRRPFPIRRPGEVVTRVPFGPRPAASSTTTTEESVSKSPFGPRPAFSTTTTEAVEEETETPEEFAGLRPFANRDRPVSRPPFIPPRRPAFTDTPATNPPTTNPPTTTAEPTESQPSIFDLFTNLKTTTTTTQRPQRPQLPFLLPSLRPKPTPPRPIESDDIANLLLQDVFNLPEGQNSPPVQFTPARPTPKPIVPVKLSTALPEIPSAVRDQLPLAIDPVLASGILKLSGCNIYGRMYDVGEKITELSAPCKECQCTPVGVQCLPVC